jgi:hypothetical protein
MTTSSNRNGSAKAKTRQVSISTRPLDELKISPENDRLYKPVDPSDPDIQALARSIQDFGVREPLVITLDGYILSGHRRYAACQLAGVKQVPVRVEPISHDDPRFLLLLREFNRQRVKSVDEVVREEIVSMDPEEAYRLLVEHRDRKAKVECDRIEIEGVKRRAEITKAKKPFLDAILRVLKEHRGYWPLSDRRIHYALLNDPPLIHASKPNSLGS